MSFNKFIASSALAWYTSTVKLSICYIGAG